jgi:lipopolysaccharide export system permease protein
METADLRGISAGRFTEYSHGDLIFYTEEIDSHLKMHNIFIQDRQHGEPNTINAEYGSLKELPTGKYVVLENGEGSRGSPGKSNFILETFQEYAVRIDKKTNPINYNADSVSTQSLIQSSKITDKVELQKRLSLPLSVLFLSFLAVPLAKLSPRGGVYGSLIFAFLIYFIYGNISQVTRSWMLHGVIPIELGYVWVYLFLGLLGIVLLVRLYGWRWIILYLKGGKIA